jgi:hypothetical protein
MARVADVQGGAHPPVAMLFDSVLADERYMADLDALEHRWRALAR